MRHMNRKRLALSEVLRRALLVGLSVSAPGCLGTTSCPDNGVEPPVSGVVPIALTDPDPDVQACQTLCRDLGTSLITCVRTAPEEVLCVAEPYPCEGRRPYGWLPSLRREARAFERHLADAAQLEAASVDAFALLVRELREHRAPRRLARAASRAGRDERRHARVAAALARRFHVHVEPVAVAAKPSRSLE